MAKEKIAAAAFTGGGAGKVGGRLDPRRIEAAMGAAVEKALAEGITDDGEILKLKLAARERVKDEHRVEEAAALKAAEDKARGATRKK